MVFVNGVTTTTAVYRYYTTVGWCSKGPCQANVSTGNDAWISGKWSTSGSGIMLILCPTGTVWNASGRDKIAKPNCNDDISEATK